MDAPAYQRIPSSDLKPGMIVLAPPEVNDPDLGPVALASVWPDHPPELLVTLWAFEEGETSLDAITGPKGSIDYNTQDLPAWFMVRVSSIGDCYDDGHSQRRCHDCRDRDGRALCGDCHGQNMLDRDEAEHREQDDLVRIAVLDEDGDDPSVTTLAELFESNACFDLDTRATLRKLGVGQAWAEGGGASPWYCVVRLPNMARDAFGAPFDASKE